MPTVAIVVEPTEHERATLLRGLHRLTGKSLGEIKAALVDHRPVVEASLYLNDHHEVSLLLKRVLDLVDKLGAMARVYERSSSGNEREVTPQYLVNILKRADEEIQRQKDIADQETREEN